MSPRVSFIVPCYNLGDFLDSCVQSILQQTYTSFEVLIMDDCATDNTREVGTSYHDPRIRYIRNPSNLGHLRNYNRGIELAAGDYIWLISADDLIWHHSALERYVGALDSNPDAGFAFCSAVELRGSDPSVAAYSVWQATDGILKGHEVFRRLVYANTIVAASGLVRKSMYAQYGTFPLNLPYAGDWYLWCLFSLHGNVAYFAEPLVAYRIHGGSMTDTLSKTKMRQCADDDLAVLAALVRHTHNAKMEEMCALALRALGFEYARQMRSKRYRTAIFQRTLADAEDSIHKLDLSRSQRSRLWSYTHASLGDILTSEKEPGMAFSSYARSLKFDPLRLRTWLKIVLSMAGRYGGALRAYAARVLKTSCAPVRLTTSVGGSKWKR